MEDQVIRSCFICRKHCGLEKVPGGAIYQNALIYISHASLQGDETAHYLGHIFVEPKRHIPELAQLTEEEAREIGLYVSLSARAIQAVCGAEHVYSFVIGDHVSHVHVHVMGRYPGAPREYWGSKVDDWPDAPRGGFEEIEALAARMREYFLGLR